MRPPFAIREAHAHIAQHGRSMGMADLSTCRSAGDMLERLAAQSPETSGWVLAHGARPEGWADPRWPTLAQLDRAAAGRPLAAWCFDYHALVASTPALAAARIDAATRIEGGVVQLDAAGEPTGLLLERAALALWASVPEPGVAERREHARLALADLARLGYASVCDLKAQPWLPETMAELERAGALACDVELWPLVEDLPPMAATRASFESARVRLGGGKVFVDGTLNSRTAWMLRPYADAPPDRPRGTPMMTPAQVEAAVRACDALGLPLAAHAIGDAAVRCVLDAIERVRPSAPGSRIEHLEVLDAADVPRFAELGVTASVQPCHLLADVEALSRALPDRLDRVLPLRDLLEAGCQPGAGPHARLVFGSDVPIVRAHPDDSIQAAVHRRRASMMPESAIAPAQALTQSEAWSCFACAR